MVAALEQYLRAALQSSATSVLRSLASLPTLERTLADVAARCQNVVTLETVLEAARPPVHPLRHLLSPTAAAAEKASLLQPLLAVLETGSLASYFWRTLAGSLAPRVQELVNRGGVAARALRTNRTGVGEAVRECVIHGSQPPAVLVAAAKGKARAAEPAKAGAWEREVAVMVGSVVGNIGS